MPEFAFDFDDDDLDRHGALLARLAERMPLANAYLDRFSHELVIVAPDYDTAARQAEAIVRLSTRDTPELYLVPIGRN
ncbi:MAG TPA: hypothetical protein VHB30_10040 [Solirubrobacteraceae bacterium]|jgi:hypothetical protein|nr:hypothetical protein [Solirubrobacteraceae bacterium]